MTEYDNVEKWLPEDLTGEATTNFVENEVHTVVRASTVGATTEVNSFDASYGKTIIISPYCGAFYDKGLTIKLKVDDNDPINVTDYRLVGLDLGRTRISSCKGAGVYRFIHLTGDTSVIPDNAKIIITYHAFGGEISERAYQQLLSLIENSSGGGGGGGSGDYAPASTVAALSDKVDLIAQRINFNPSYGYQTKLDKEASSWLTIAVSSADLDAYINLSDASTLTGTGSFDIFSNYMHGTYNFTYEVVPAPSGSSVKAVQLSCNVENQKLMDFDVATKDMDSFFNGQIVVPVFRLMYYTGALTGSNHRLYLQMALVSNITGTAGSYKMVVSDKTDFVEKAANLSVSGQIFDAWDMSTVATPGANYVLSNMALGLEDYYKVWEGNASLAFIEDLSWTRVQLNHDYNTQSQLSPTHTAKGYTVFPFAVGKIPPSAVKSFRVDIYDRYEEKLITATCIATASKPYASATPTEVYGCVNFFPYDNCLLELFYTNVTYTTSTTKAVIRLYSNSGNSSYLNQRFDLRAIYIK